MGPWRSPGVQQRAHAHTHATAHARTRAAAVVAAAVCRPSVGHAATWAAGLAPAPFSRAPKQDAQQVPNLRETSMLYTWVQHRISLYLEALKKHLRSITEGGNLASVIEHCMVRAGAA